MSTLPATSFESFRTDAIARGFDEVLERHWPPLQVLDDHVHGFAVDALVVQGEMWLTVDGNTQHLRPGERFALLPGVPHAERYGPVGATYWVARRGG